LDSREEENLARIRGALCTPKKRPEPNVKKKEDEKGKVWGKSSMS